MSFQGKNKKSSSNHRKDDEKKASTGTASKRSGSPTIAGTSSGAPQKRVLNTASLADILGFQPKPSTPKEEASVPQKWEPFYRKLLRLQTLLTDGNVAPEAGDEELLEFVTDRSRTLVEVRAAIERIFNGTYGICELTRKPIEPQRLAVIPYARCSLEGQRQTETFCSDAFVSETEEEEERDEEEPLYSTDDETDE